MKEQEHKILSVAALSADLAWNLLTPEQQQQLLKYLEEAHKEDKNDEKTQEIRPTR